MNKNAKKWVKALRSGEYQQAKRRKDRFILRIEPCMADGYKYWSWELRQVERFGFFHNQIYGGVSLESHEDAERQAKEAKKRYLERQELKSQAVEIEI